MDGRPEELTAKQSALKCGDTMKYKARSEVPTSVLIMFQVLKNVALGPEDIFKFSRMLFLILKTDTQRSSDMSVNIYLSTRRNIAESSNLQ
jgi:hypothetical protein